MPNFGLKCKKCSYSKVYLLNRFVDKEGLKCEECGHDELVRDFRNCRILISDVYTGDTCHGMTFQTQSQRDDWCKRNNMVRISDGEAMQEQKKNKFYKDKKEKEEFSKTVKETTAKYLREKNN